VSCNWALWDLEDFLFFHFSFLFFFCKNIVLQFFGRTIYFCKIEGGDVKKIDLEIKMEIVGIGSTKRMNKGNPINH
jgi:hypothetical protein